MKKELTPERITELALANGFKLKEQPDGAMALNPYVFDFARALLAAQVIQPLTKEQIAEVGGFMSDGDLFRAFVEVVRDIERAHGIGMAQTVQPEDGPLIDEGSNP
jgi:hypothetical protein